MRGRWKWIGLLVVLALLVKLWDFDGVTEPNPPQDQESTGRLSTIDNRQASIRVEAQTENEYGIGKNTSFTVYTDEEIGYDDLVKNLSFSPSLAFNLHELRHNVYEAKPLESLMANTVYSVTYQALNYGKAFQVADTIQVYQSYPGGGAKNLPTSTAVEIKFNSPIDDGIIDYFKIEPNVAGTFDIRDKTLIFMPKNLIMFQEYRVTIEAGYQSNNRQMEEAYSFVFKTGRQEDFNTDITYSMKSHISNTAALVSINTWRFDDDYQVEIFNALDFTNFKDAYDTFMTQRSALETIDYPQVFNSQVEPIELASNQYIELPQLDDGYYIVRLSGQSLIQYVFLQIGPHDIYYNQNKRNTLLWVLDKTTGQLLRDAEVEINGKIQGKTDRQGVFLGDYIEETRQVIVTIGDYKYLVNHLGQAIEGYYDDEDYYHTGNAWSFLYTDRETYVSNDRINVFGFARSYEGETPKTLNLDLQSYFSDQILQTKKVVLDDDGSFTDFLDLDSYEFGYYQLVLRAGDRVLTRDRVLVSNYEKPEVYLTSSVEPKYLMAGEKASYQVTAKYANEMPYEGMDLDIHLDSKTQNRQVTTDSAGQVVIDFEPQVESQNWRPSLYTLSSYSRGIEKHQASSHATMHVFSRDMTLRGEASYGDGYVDLNVLTHELDLSKYVIWHYDTLHGQGLSADVTIRVYEIHYKKKFVETKYDPINKVSYDVYSYHEVKEEWDPVDLKTLDGLGTYSFPVEEDHYYRIELTARDLGGRLVKEIVTTSGALYKGHHQVDYNNLYTIDQSQDTYDLGDQVYRRILRYGEDFKSQSDHWVLALMLRNGLIDYEVIKGNYIDFDFIDLYRPNVLLKAVFFDGETMHILPKYSSQVIGYDYDQLEGSIQVLNLEGGYKPGDQVTFDLEVKRHDGSPFTGRVNVSVVDEAYFALYPDYFEIEKSLHKYVTAHGILNESTMSDDRKNILTPDMEDGTVDEGGLRDDFVDTAYFKTVLVRQGKAHVAFDLPDNLSRFRITLQGVNKNLEYVTHKTGVNISLPYFIRPLFDKDYLVGDKVYLTMKSDGDRMDPGQVTTYELFSNDTGIHESTVEGKHMGHLYLGMVDQDLSYTIKGSHGEFFDGIAGELRVKDYFLDFPFKRYVRDLTDFAPSNDRGISELVFLDQEAVSYIDEIHKAYSYNQVRLEEILARSGAYKLLRERFDLSYTDDPDVSDFISWSGGLKALKTGEADLRTSATIVATQFSMDHLDAKNLVAYLYAALEEVEMPMDLKAYCLWALASQGEPVLLLVNNLLEETPYETLSSSSQMFIIYALFEMGDIHRVTEMAHIFFAREDLVHLSSRNYILAATLNERLAYGAESFKTFTLDDVVSNDTMSMERVYYLYHKKRHFNGGTLTYEVNGNLERVNLSVLDQHHLILDPMEDFYLLEASENMAVLEYYRVTALDEPLHKSTIYKMHKTMEEGSVRVGDLVKVTLAFDKPAKTGVWIQDRIPAGFEYAGYQTPVDQVLIDLNHENKKIEIYYQSKEEGGSLVYYMRAMQKGTYQIEPTAIYGQVGYDLYMTPYQIIMVD